MVGGGWNGVKRVGVEAREKGWVMARRCNNLFNVKE